VTPEHIVNASEARAVILLVLLIPIVIGAFMLAMERLENELLGPRPQPPRPAWASPS
jgi:hypothetical protein